MAGQAESGEADDRRLDAAVADVEAVSRMSAADNSRSVDLSREIYQTYPFDFEALIMAAFRASDGEQAFKLAAMFPETISTLTGMPVVRAVYQIADDVLKRTCAG